MSDQRFPALAGESFAATRDALHAYSKVLGDRLKAARPRRKHWWHASLRPSLTGLTTGPVLAGRPFELELDLAGSQLRMRAGSGEERTVELEGQSVNVLVEAVAAFLRAQGADPALVPAPREYASANAGHPGYSVEQAQALGQALSSVRFAMQALRADIKNETSPIQLWPHHFDLSMLWLPGTKIPGQDPEDEEYSDKQMNFGFAFGDESNPAPYFYVTAYPAVPAMGDAKLPPGAVWESEGFVGVLVQYETLTQTSDPEAYLLGLWRQLLAIGREHI